MVSDAFVNESLMGFKGAAATEFFTAGVAAFLATGAAAFLLAGAAFFVAGAAAFLLAGCSLKFSPLIKSGPKHLAFAPHPTTDNGTATDGVPDYPHPTLQAPQRG